MLSYQVLADLVLLVHFAIALFVVSGLPLIVVGNALGWMWVNGRLWRQAHLIAIAVVVLQALLGRYCFLTYLENRLRSLAGQESYDVSFVEHWVGQLLYHDLPLWVFGLLYVVFGGLIAWAWWKYPPQARS